jgi:hypothetical protein
MIGIHRVLSNVPAPSMFASRQTKAFTGGTIADVFFGNVMFSITESRVKTLTMVLGWPLTLNVSSYN